MEHLESLVGRDSRRNPLIVAAVAMAVAASFVGGMVVGRLPLELSFGAGVDAPAAPASVPAPATSDVAGRTTATTAWSRYDPQYGSYAVAAVDAAGRTGVDTDWRSYNPAYGSFSAAGAPRIAADALGRSTADTDWRFYNPQYGSYRLVAADARGRTTPGTDWRFYNPQYGSWRR